MAWLKMGNSRQSLSLTDRIERSHNGMWSVLRLVLFHTFINDLAEQVSSEVISFAVVLKLFRAVRKRTDCKELPKDHTRQSDRAMKRQIKFCVGKCKVMGMGKNNPSFTVIGIELVLANQE